MDLKQSVDKTSLQNDGMSCHYIYPALLFVWERAVSQDIAWRHIKDGQ